MAVATNPAHAAAKAALRWAGIRHQRHTGVLVTPFGSGACIVQVVPSGLPIRRWDGYYSPAPQGPGLGAVVLALKAWGLTPYVFGNSVYVGNYWPEAAVRAQA